MLLACFFLLSVILLVLAWQRPVWAVGYYLLTYFAQPQYWAWGEALPRSIRWSMMAAIVLLVSALFHYGFPTPSENSGRRRAGLVILLMLANATVVHLGLAFEPTRSLLVYLEMAKLVLLFFLLLVAIRTTEDFKLFLLMLAGGVAYWGLQAKFGAIEIVDGRLEKFGGPGCYTSNELASIMVALLPLVGALLFITRGPARLLAIAASALGLNILLLCNSRAGFLAIIVSAAVVLIASSGSMRRYSNIGLALGLLATVALLGNPKVIERFLTTFHDKEDAARSRELEIAYGNKETRLAFWGAGLAMIADYPLGSGGGAFSGAPGISYQKPINQRNRSVHQGFLKDACDWGIQGLVLRLTLLGTGAWCAWRTLRFQARHEPSYAFLGVCILAAMAGWLVTCCFGDMLHLEWGYWITAIALIYDRVCGQDSDFGDTEEHVELQDEDVYLQLPDEELAESIAV